MATFTFFESFVRDLGNGTIDLDTHTFKWALTNTLPDTDADETLSAITQISGGGYAVQTAANVTWAETSAGSGVWKFSHDDVVWTASGADMGPFRYAVLYDDTPTSPADPLIGVLDYGSGLTVPDGGTFTLDIGANGVFQGAGSP